MGCAHRTYPRSAAVYALLAAALLLGCGRENPRPRTLAEQFGTASVAPTKRPNVIAAPLKKLLDRMTAIAADFPEVEDTDVREQTHDAIYRAFVLQDAAYDVPVRFGMFTPKGNAAVRAALVEFLDAARPLAARAGLRDARARLNAFQDVSVHATNGETFDSYFGERPAP
jgi:hypothetical protein